MLDRGWRPLQRLLPQTSVPLPWYPRGDRNCPLASFPSSCCPCQCPAGVPWAGPLAQVAAAPRRGACHRSAGGGCLRRSRCIRYCRFRSQCIRRCFQNQSILCRLHSRVSVAAALAAAVSAARTRVTAASTAATAAAATAFALAASGAFSSAARAGLRRCVRWCGAHRQRRVKWERPPRHSRDSRRARQGAQPGAARARSRLRARISAVILASMYSPKRSEMPLSGARNLMADGGSVFATSNTKRLSGPIHPASLRAKLQMQLGRAAAPVFPCRRARRGRPKEADLSTDMYLCVSVCRNCGDGTASRPNNSKLSRLASNSFIEPYREAGGLLYGGWQYFKVLYLLQVCFSWRTLEPVPGRGRYLNDLVLWHFSQALPKLPPCASSFAWQP